MTAKLTRRLQLVQSFHDEFWVSPQTPTRVTPFAATQRQHATVPTTTFFQLTGTPSPHTRVIVARAECDYRAPAYFGDELEVRLKVGRVGGSSFTLEYEIGRMADERVVAEGKTVMVSYDYAAGAPVPLPDATRALLAGLGST